MLNSVASEHAAGAKCVRAFARSAASPLQNREPLLKGRVDG